MKTITKKQITEKFEDEIQFPEMVDDEVIYMRSELQKLYHQNTVYRDGGKLYLEDHVDAIYRLAKRLGIEVDTYNYENLDYCLYLSGNVMKDAVRKYQERYF